MAKRPVGRPRQFDDTVERRLILDAAYSALRDRGPDFTIADILSTAGVSTRSLYRHFESKDALLRAMFLRDGEWAAARLTARLQGAGSPGEAVELWIDELYSIARSPRRAERVTVLGSITGLRSDGDDDVTARGRELLVAPLRGAIVAGCDDGSFTVSDAGVASELIWVVTMHAAGLGAAHRPLDQSSTVEFCMHALGATTGPRARPTIADRSDVR